MRKLTVGLLIFMAGLSLGWYMHYNWGSNFMPFSQPLINTPSTNGSPETPAAGLILVAPAVADELMRLLQRNEFAAVVDRYESLQAEADDATVAAARTRILAHARKLIGDRHFGLAEQLLQGFLVAAYHDVEGRVLLAEAYHGRQDYLAAMAQLYEAKGYAYRPAVLEKITRRIRAMVAEATPLLKDKQDHNALLSLYQQLTQLEPDHAPYFLGLAATQLMLENEPAARRSLLLVSQDPEIGTQAQNMLLELDLASAPPAAEEEVAGIPLHRDGNHFIVDALPSHGRGIRLLIDTGASLTIFSPEVLEQRGIRYQDTGRTEIFRTANGPVRGPIYTLESLTVGDWRVHQLDIGVLDMGNRSAIDGLLGMNFLNKFQFFIDQNEALLRLSAN